MREKTLVYFTISIIAIVVGYTWLMVPIIGVNRWLGGGAVALVLALCTWRALSTGEWGLSWISFLPSLGWSLVFTLPVLALICGVGFYQETIRIRDDPFHDFLFLFLWAWGQQFALHTVILKEARTIFSATRAILAAATTFAVLHLPNPFLVPLTFLGAVIWCWIYSRHPNLIPLALSHSAVSLMILSSLDSAVTGGMRIGYSYF
ncbi:CPBP family intramembrane metalloprotease [Acidobacteria bacterium AH-259-D05]|nr:CPBP family intramembrane metalloprotease [Acidobacteria bacterium AH-259-D05]